MFKNLIQSALRKIGLEIRPLQSDLYKDFLLHEEDQVFNKIYSAGLRITNTPEVWKRRARFYNLSQLFLYVRHFDGRTAECGCWRGLSSYLLCSYEKLIKGSYEGECHEIYDSFIGLSNPTNNDMINNKNISEFVGPYGGKLEDFSASLDLVKTNLSDFSKIHYFPGWIPQSLDPKNKNFYKFVHIDVDLYEPTKGALEYFYPKLCRGGFIVCDDYGSLRWPGAKKAVEEFCEKEKIKFVSLSTGQALIIN